MKRPTAIDFGLTEEAIGSAIMLEKCARIFTFIFAPIVIPFIKPILSHNHPIWSIFIAWLGVWLTLWAGALICLRITNKTYRAVKRFQKAKALFEQWWVRTQEQFWRSLSGVGFERELASLYKRTGIKATLTPASGDGGVDIWLDYPDGKVIVQCKAHRSPIGPSVARELHGTLKHFGAKGAVLASTSGFTRGVWEFSRGKPIKLLGLKEIIEMQKALDQ